MILKEIKRKKQIEKLFNEIKADFNFADIPVTLEIKRKGNFNCMRASATQLLGIKEITIIIGINSIADRVKQGYNNVYYEGRKEKINPFILGNRHATYRFIILHELNHASELIKEGWQDYEAIPTYTKEASADNHALNNLRRF